MKRNIVSMLTMGAIMLSLIGCGKSGNNNAENNPENSAASSIEITAEGNLPDFGNIPIGDTVVFGNYTKSTYARRAKPEPIEWIVLDHQDGKTLLLTKYGLEDAVRYHQGYSADPVTWAECSCREYLNGRMLEDSFTAEERSAIALSHLTTPDASPEIWGDIHDENYRWPEGGEDTDDYVFLLSAEEASKYLGVKAMSDFPKEFWGSETDFGVITYEDGTYEFVTDEIREKYGLPSYECLDYDNHEGCLYMLRSPAHTNQSCYTVVGSIFGTYAVNDPGAYLRPAIWVYDEAPEAVEALGGNTSADVDSVDEENFEAADLHYVYFDGMVLERYTRQPELDEHGWTTSGNPDYSGTGITRDEDHTGFWISTDLTSTNPKPEFYVGAEAVTWGCSPDTLEKVFGDGGYNENLGDKVVVSSFSIDTYYISFYFLKNDDGEFALYMVENGYRSSKPY